MAELGIVSNCEGGHDEFLNPHDQTLPSLIESLQELHLEILLVRSSLSSLVDAVMMLSLSR
jgi:hypothetical protein